MDASRSIMDDQMGYRQKMSASLNVTSTSDDCYIPTAASHEMVSIMGSPIIISMDTIIRRFGLFPQGVQQQFFFIPFLDGNFKEIGIGVVFSKSYGSNDYEQWKVEISSISKDAHECYILGSLVKVSSLHVGQLTEVPIIYLTILENKPNLEVLVINTPDSSSKQAQRTLSPEYNLGHLKKFDEIALPIDKSMSSSSHSSCKNNSWQSKVANQIPKDGSPLCADVHSNLDNGNTEVRESTWKMFDLMETSEDQDVAIIKDFVIKHSLEHLDGESGAEIYRGDDDDDNTQMVTKKPKIMCLSKLLVLMLKKETKEAIASKFMGEHNVDFMYKGLDRFLKELQRTTPKESFDFKKYRDGMDALDVLKLTHQDVFTWSEESEQQFREVKEILASLPTIAPPKWDENFYVNPTVGNDTLGAVLMQKGHETSYMRPIYFSSRMMIGPEKGYTPVEHMVLALMFATQKFRPYLLPKKFIILTVEEVFPYVESSTRASLAGILTHCHFEKKVKPQGEEVLPPSELVKLEEAHSLYFDGAYKRIIDKAVAEVVVSDEEGEKIFSTSGLTKGQRQWLVCKATRYRLINDDLYCKGKDQVLRKQLGISRRHSSPYYPQCNGLVEKVNGMICRIITKQANNRPKDWDRHLNAALWAYRTSFKTTLGYTPYQLVFGKKVILPIEVQLASLRVLASGRDRPSVQLRSTILELERLELDRTTAIEHYVAQAMHRKKKFDENLKDKGLKKGMLVLRYDNRFDTKKYKKFMVRWEGPFLIYKKYTNGNYRLQVISGKLHTRQG
ncbi:hypothetical protein L7F22_025893 [Adiantum nelumboides]|nr:hypothetical protein [Adiantum nelumboides]